MNTENNEHYKNKNIILTTVLLLAFMTSFDGSIINVALPSMSKSLSVNTQSISWVFSSYLIAICTLILAFGKLGDLKGKIRVFKTGIFIFTLGSLMCGISTTLPFLITSRIVQAVGAAAAMATSQGIITEAVPKNEIGKAFGLFGTFIALGTMMGAPIGGFIISLFNWNYVFLLNIPFGIITFILCIKFLPKEHVNKGKFPDIKGFLLFVVTIVTFFFSVIQGGALGYSNPFIIGSFVTSIITFVLFIYTENKSSEPMLDLGLFKSKLFSISIFCSFLSFVAIFCLLIVNPFYLHYTRECAPAFIGLLMMFYSIVLTLSALFSGILSDKTRPEILTFTGLIIMGAGFFLMTMLGVSTPIPLLLAFMAVIGFGAGLFQSPNNSLVMSAVNRNKLGIAGSVNALVRNIGMSVGIAIATTLLYSRMSSKAGYRVLTYIEENDNIFLYGMRYVYTIAGILCIIGAIITFIRFRNQKGNINNAKLNAS
ncbi:MFS transporter [Sebaldella sp. S0638]|uniref:MFS transporter n=1 Tax=Sebaldella sp. S0638 TaxID=2957809 RepID=UPI00209FB188|nr:MFS transporter [Sebaldella sp. S0638]MCP1225663.1 MFS transporter [Sebaldella sp. S0638]